MTVPTTFSLGGEINVHRMGFGALRIIGPDLWGEPADRAAALALLRTVVDSGVNFIDTADVYGPDVSERLIAEALYPYPSDLVITTKGGRTLDRPGVWGTDSRPETLRRRCDDSLRRLRLDSIDLYQLHAVDPDVPVEDSVGALVELREAGKIRHIGLSNVTAEELIRATAVTPIASVQNRYNLLARGDEPVLDECARRGIAFLPWQPIAKAELSNNTSLVEIASRHGVTAVQIALAWLLHHSRVIVPIPGTADSRHLIENLAAARITLTVDDLLSLDSQAPVPANP